MRTGQGHRDVWGRRSRVLAGVALGLGTVHAGFSVFWALGGTWLLATVGAWAVEAGREDPVGAGLVLGTVAAVKLVAAVVPVLLAHGRLPWPRLWRGACWVGAAGLVLYGPLNVVVSSAVLLGVVDPEGGYDRAAMLGHALLWDPLFALWGAALLGALWLSRRRRVGDDGSGEGGDGGGGDDGGGDGGGVAGPVATGVAS